jgi:hypothetical protein
LKTYISIFTQIVIKENKKTTRPQFALHWCKFVKTAPNWCDGAVKHKCRYTFIHLV